MLPLLRALEIDRNLRNSRKPDVPVGMSPTRCLPWLPGTPVSLGLGRSQTRCGTSRTATLGGSSGATSVCTALDRGAYRHAQSLLRHHDTEVEPAALWNVANWLNQAGQFAAARDWYRRVISTNDPDYVPRAMVDLGILENNQGNTDKARSWYEGAIATDHPRLCAEGVGRPRGPGEGPGRYRQGTPLV